MDDYISVLLEHLSDRLPTAAGSEYYTCLARERAAYEALSNTLTPEQQELLLRYDERRNATACAVDEVYARQAFLLARSIFR